MVNQIDVKGLMEKTRRYEFADGLREIQIGVFMLLGGVVWFGVMYQPYWIKFIMETKARAGSFATWLAFFVVFLIPMLAVILVNRAIESVRRRWLWRESGMIKSSQMAGQWQYNLWATALFFVILAGGLYFSSIFKTGEFYAWSLILMASGWSFALVLIGLGRKIKLQRYIYLGWVGSAYSALLLLSQNSLIETGLAYAIGWGVILLASGLIALRRVWPAIEE
ncbi:MAG: hypothetical protein OEY93_00940 [Anaerolineae bacterium]|nr:hypothetical protein [Anaerolineae bacterium]